jgi:hypothetical protein
MLLELVCCFVLDLDSVGCTESCICYVVAIFLVQLCFPSAVTWS